MLVLTRKSDETIVIGENITITILEIRGDTVKIGISAPRSVSVHRGEVLSVVAGENLSAAAAASVSPGDLAALLHSVGAVTTHDDGRTAIELSAGKAPMNPL